MTRLVSPADNTHSNIEMGCIPHSFNALISLSTPLFIEYCQVQGWTLPRTTSLAGSDASASCVVKSLAVTWHCHRPSSNSKVADLTHKEQSPMSGRPTHSYFFKCIPIGWNDSSREVNWRSRYPGERKGREIGLSNGNIMSGNEISEATLRFVSRSMEGDHYRESNTGRALRKRNEGKA